MFAIAPISESRPNHNSLREVHWSLTANQYRKNVGDGTYGLSSISEKTNHLQMSLLRQQILLLFEDPECWSGLDPRPLLRHSSTLLPEPTRGGKYAYNKSYDYINDDNDHDNDDIIPINLSFTFRTLSDNPIKTIEPGAFSFGVSSNTRV